MIKEEIRKINKQKRNNLSKNEAYSKSDGICLVFLESDIYKNSNVIMLYKEIGNEVSTKAIYDKIIEDKKIAVYPKTVNGKIIPLMVDEKTEFEKGEFSINVPKKNKLAEIEKIDAVIVPGIAFDKRGARVGFGKGCYDEFLKKTNALKIGCCYDFQIEEYIKEDSHDIFMDYLLCEKEIIECKK